MLINLELLDESGLKEDERNNMIASIIAFQPNSKILFNIIRNKIAYNALYGDDQLERIKGSVETLDAIQNFIDEVANFNLKK